VKQGGIVASKKRTSKRAATNNQNSDVANLPVGTRSEEGAIPVDAAKPADEGSAPRSPVANSHRIRTEEFSRELTCKLDDKGVLERASRAAKVLQRKLDLESEFDEERKRWKGLISKAELEHRMLSQEVRTRETLREVQCERVFDFTAAEVYECRLDTFERIDTRPMTKAERQGRLSIV
jgi:hypothetical protein